MVRDVCAGQGRWHCPLDRGQTEDSGERRPVRVSRTSSQLVQLAATYPSSLQTSDPTEEMSTSQCGFSQKWGVFIGFDPSNAPHVSGVPNDTEIITKLGGTTILIIINSGRYVFKCKMCILISIHQSKKELKNNILRSIFVNSSLGTNRGTRLFKTREEGTKPIHKTCNMSVSVSFMKKMHRFQSLQICMTSVLNIILAETFWGMNHLRRGAKSLVKVQHRVRVSSLIVRIVPA